MDHFETPNIGLIMYRANDIPSYLQDWNDTMYKLDEYLDIINSRLYEYVTTLANINQQLKEHKLILDEALRTSQEAMQLANSVSKTLESLIHKINDVDIKVNNRIDALEVKINNQFTTINNNIQNIYNQIAALDTKLDNAITGGDLIAPSTTNLLLIPYTAYTEAGQTPGGAVYPTEISNSENSFRWTAPETRTRTTIIYGRTYQPVEIKGSTAKPCYLKANINFSAPYNREQLGDCELKLLENSTVVHSITANFSGKYSANIRTNLNINNWNKKNLSVRIISTMATGDYAICECSINQLTITNQ